MTLPLFGRRLLTPLLAGLMIVAFVVAVVVGVVGLVAAVFDRRARILRLAVMAGVYAGLEVLVLLLMLGTWLIRVTHASARDHDRQVVGWALGSLLRAACLFTGFRVELEEPPNLGPFQQEDPVLVLARHGGIGDSFALAHLLIARYGRRPRIVLKRVLRWDPMLDVALTRMGACWVGPSSNGAGPRAIGEMAAGARPGEAVLLFPEGGNWTARRRLSIMARFWKAGRPDALRTAALMEHVLPPRPGGVLATLDNRPDMPVVVMAHTGLDRITSAGELWRALPFRVPMRLRWWPAAPAPSGEDDRLRWLTTEWAVVDQWIDASRP